MSNTSIGVRCSLVPGASFVLVAAVSASAAAAASTLETLTAAKGIENIRKTKKMTKLSHYEIATHALKMTTGRLQSHLVQNSTQQTCPFSTNFLGLTSYLCVLVMTCQRSMFGDKGL